MTPEQEATRGENARRYVEDPLVQEAFAAIHEALHDQWEHSKSDEVDGREAAYFMLKSFNTFKEFFATVIADGDFAKDTIERKARQAIKKVK